MTGVVDLIFGAGPVAVLLAVLPLLVLVIGVIMVEPGGPPIRWTRLVLPPGAGLAIAGLAGGGGAT